MATTQSRVTAACGLRVRSDRVAMVNMMHPAPRPVLARPAPALAQSRAIVQHAIDAQFRAAHATVAAWIDDNAAGDEFAGSLLRQLKDRGTLTDRQVEAVNRSIERATAGAQAVKTATVVDMSKIADAIAAAEASGLDRIKLRLGEFAFKPAARHPGVVYVTTNNASDEGAGVYLGKIQGGKLFATGECTQEMKAGIAAVAVDPAAAAVAYGRQTGRCSCCGLKLTDPVSVELGIGPICREKWGF
jgi:Family of unknown function (DUF6011)